MLRFANEDYLYALAAIPVFLFLFILIRIRKKRSLKKFGDASLVGKLIPGGSGGKSWMKFIALMLAYAFLIVGIADLQIGTKLEEVKREGVDVMIALDVSNSMKAEDIRPSRIERAKQTIAKLIDNLQNDRIGIIVFAGQAFVQLPLTSDFGAAKLFLSGIDTDIISSQGTAIGSAIDLAIKSMDTKDKKHKVLIVITDGENHEDDAVEAAKVAKKDGIIVHTIGMGSQQGAPIPVYKNNTKSDYLKDSQGKIVITKLDEGALQQIAKAGQGVFIRASNSDDGLKTILHEIAGMQKKNYGSKVVTDYEDRFQYFLGVAFLLLIIELLISERKSKWVQNLNLFETKSSKKSSVTLLALVAGFFGLLTSIIPVSGYAQSQSEKEIVREGNSQYKNEKYSDAEISYRKALEKNKDSQTAAFNLGDALYKQGKYEEAAIQFQQITAEKGNSSLKAKAYHNLGNSYLKTKKLEESISAYKNSLKMAPNDQETKYNLAYAKSLLVQQQNQNKKDKDKKDDKNKDKNQQNKDQQKKDDEKKDKKNKDENDKNDNKNDDKNNNGAPPPQPQKLSQEDAQRILDALNRKENDMHKKLDKKGSDKNQIEKNW